MANPKIQLKYKTDKKNEKDSVEIEINTEAQNLLKKVILEQTVQDVDMGQPVFERYKVKQFVGDFFYNRQWFRLLFAKELLTTKKLTRQVDLTKYVEWCADLRGNPLKALLEKIYAFSDKEYEVEYERAE